MAGLQVRVPGCCAGWSGGKSLWTNRSLKCLAPSMVVVKK